MKIQNKERELIHDYGELMGNLSYTPVYNLSSNKFLYILFLAPLFIMSFGINGYYFYTDILLLVMNVGIMLFVSMNLILNNTKKYSGSFFYLYIITIGSLVINILITETINNDFFYLIFALNIYFLISNFKIDKDKLLKITNTTYLIYLALSFLLYFSVITINGRSLNIFDEIIFGYSIKTFIGYYGSTAHLDSYSMFIALLNLFFNKNRLSKLFFVVLALIACFGTLRFTPIVSLGYGIIFLLIVQILGKYTVPLINVIIFMFFYLVVIFYTHSDVQYHSYFFSATSGRNVIWSLMLDVYNNIHSITQKSLGFGTTEPFTVDAFGAYETQLTNNPHNNYLRFIFEYGVISFIGVFIFFTKRMMEIKKKSILLIIFFVLMASNTNSEIFSFFHPTFLIWILFFFKNPENTSETQES
ncbi:O-antigen ligase family protein [Pseudalkalibacillus caeni]|uniref:Oligosaccharide repeat unit polymerase n=1 Tax=Exobacillus caeni TaxID=2574798 RepID=A0A5R9EWG5_9BACL|nr:O-antigen ligase family protein [Pseudalkalibacillus caeni]TLS35161.1 oligosaccharide repeat unit polymerase [Pseudalkalibacillus caeni]